MEISKELLLLHFTSYIKIEEFIYGYDKYIYTEPYYSWNIEYALQIEYELMILFI